MPSPTGRVRSAARLAEVAAANGGVLPTDAALQVVLGRLVPVLVVFGLLLLLAGLLFQGAGWHSVLRRANAESVSITEGVRFAGSRLPALLGWSLAGGLLIAVVLGLPLLPGVLSDSGPVMAVGTVLAVVAGLLVGVGVFSVLPGVVLIERAGLGRAVELLRGRWLRTGVRMAVASAIYVAYSLSADLLVSGVAALTGPGLVASLVQGATVIPAMVFQLVVAVVTYAELRGRVDGTNTGGLAAELVGRRARRVSSPGAWFGPGAGWRGLPWVAPVLVVAMLAAVAPALAGGVGSVSADVGLAASRSPMGPVSPVPSAPEDTGPGGDGGSAGTEPAVTGSGDAGADEGGNEGGGDAPPVADGDARPEGEDGRSGGDGETPPVEATAKPPEGERPAHSQGPPPTAEVAAPPGEGNEQEQQGFTSPKPDEKPDPAAATGDAAAPTDPAATVAPPPPGTDPNAPVDAAGTPVPPGTDPNADPNATQVNATCVSAATCAKPESEAVETAAEEDSGWSFSDIGHTVLDGAGMIPAFGEVADGINGVWYAAEGDGLNAAVSFGAMLPVVGSAGTGARLVGKGIKAVDEAVDAGRRADFVADANGTIVPTSKARLEEGFQQGGFPAAPTQKPGTQYTLPDGTTARVMEPSGQAPSRASFEKNGSPISPFTGKPPQPPKGLDKAERQEYIRSRTHVELGE